MKYLYSKSKDIVKFIIVEFFALSIIVAVIYEVKDNMLLFIALSGIGLVVFFFIANYYLQRLEFCFDKVVVVYLLQKRVVEIRYEQIEKAVVKHVYRDGLQLFLYIDPEFNGMSRIQWDFGRKKDQYILELLMERGVNVIMK